MHRIRSARDRAVQSDNLNVNKLQSVNLIEFIISWGMLVPACHLWALVAVGHRPVYHRPAQLATPVRRWRLPRTSALPAARVESFLGLWPLVVVGRVSYSGRMLCFGLLARIAGSARSPSLGRTCEATSSVPSPSFFSCFFSHSPTPRARIMNQRTRGMLLNLASRQKWSHENTRYMSYMNKKKILVERVEYLSNFFYAAFFSPLLSLVFFFYCD